MFVQREQIVEPGLMTNVLAWTLALSPGQRRRQLTDDPAVEVVREHPLTQGNQQPEGFLLSGVQQQDRGQDVHGLLGGHTRGDSY